MTTDPGISLSLGPEGEEQFTLLRNALETGSGFELFFVTSSSWYALEEVRRRLDTASDSPVRCTRLDYRDHDLERLLEDLLQAVCEPDPESRQAFLILARGPEAELRGSWTRTLTLLNEQRNRVIRECPAAILLFGPPWLTQIAASRSPDLWSVRSRVFSLPDSPLPIADPPLKLSAETLDAGQPRSHELREGEYYMALAEELKGSPKKAEQETRLFLLFRAATAWRLRGHYERALDALAQASSLAEAGGDHRNEIGALLGKCDILIVRGEYTQAQTILQQQILADSHLSDYERETAVAWGQMARVSEAQGNLEEALRIRREQLPVYKRLGDEGEQAATMGRIADLLQARGELDEALRIRREEELPVFEKLGDIRACAVSMGRIAAVLLEQGDLDEALRIQREEVVPVYERLGYARDLMVGRTNLAMTLLHNAPTMEQRNEALELLRLAQREARRLGLPQDEKVIAQVYRQAAAGKGKSNLSKPRDGKTTRSRRRRRPKR